MRQEIQDPAAPGGVLPADVGEGQAQRATRLGLDLDRAAAEPGGEERGVGESGPDLLRSGREQDLLLEEHPVAGDPGPARHPGRDPGLGGGRDRPSPRNIPDGRNLEMSFVMFRGYPDKQIGKEKGLNGA